VADVESKSAPQPSATAAESASTPELAAAEEDVDEKLLPIVDGRGVETSAAKEVEGTVKQDAAVEATPEAAQAVNEDEAAYEARQEAAQAAEASHNASTAEEKGNGTADARQEHPEPTLELVKGNAEGETAQDVEASLAEPSTTVTPRTALDSGALNPEPVPEHDGGREDSADVAALKRKIRDLEEDLAKATSTSAKPAEASTEPAAEAAAGQTQKVPAGDASVSNMAALTPEEMKRMMKQQLLDEMAASTTTPQETREQMTARIKAEMLRQAKAELTAETAAGQTREQPAVEAPVSSSAVLTPEEKRMRLRQQLLHEMAAAAATSTPPETRDQMKARMRAEMLGGAGQRRPA